jgi:hypothetical protein
MTIELAERGGATFPGEKKMGFLFLFFFSVLKLGRGGNIVGLICG